MKFPDNLKYAKSHEWIKIEGEHATIGISDYAQSQLGDIVYVEIETLDEDLDAKSSFGTIEAVKTVSDVYVPTACQVIEVNQAVLDSPEIINKDCYGAGWLIKVKIENADGLKDLLSASEYEASTKA